MLKKIIAITVALGLGLACFSGGMVLSNNLKDDNYAIVLAEKKEDLDSISSQLQSLKEEISTKDENYNNLQNRFNELEEDYSTLNTQYQGLLSQSKIDKQQIQSLNESISNLNSQISQLQEEIKRLSSSQQVPDEVYDLLGKILDKDDSIVYYGKVFEETPDLYFIGCYDNDKESYMTLGYNKSSHKVAVISDTYAFCESLIYNDIAYSYGYSGSQEAANTHLLRLTINEDDGLKLNVVRENVSGSFYSALLLGPVYVQGTDSNDSPCVFFGCKDTLNEKSLFLEINSTTGEFIKEYVQDEIQIDGQRVRLSMPLGVYDEFALTGRIQDSFSVEYRVIYQHGEFIKTYPYFTQRQGVFEGNDSKVWSSYGFNYGSLPMKFIIADKNTYEYIAVTDAIYPAEYASNKELAPFTYIQERNVVTYESTDSHTYEIDLNTLTKSLVQ